MSIDFQRYLESICRKYQQWWSLVDTLTNTVDLQKADGENVSSLFDFGLMAQIIEPRQRQNEIYEKTERLSVLEGLRKYAAHESLLLIGRPGAGKSTTLTRLLVESAKEALQNQQSQIPVLVELRYYKNYYKTSVLDLVQAFLNRHKLRLDISTLEDLLFEGQFLLLMDGINELPDNDARTNIKLFCRDNSNTPMIFTTRDGGDDLGIEKKLEMQALSDVEVQRFIDDCMPGQTREIIQQLRDRVRELGQTPLVMWMLYFIFQKTQDVPLSSGEALRKFTRLYERDSKFKDDVPVTEESRRWWSGLLEHLAFEMMHADKPTDFRLSISERNAKKNFTEFLQGKDEYPEGLAIICLNDLLKYHLIQRNLQNDEIEFCHQLLQEYYAAEFLLQRLDQISPEQLKYYYLNYLKWTEPLSLMLALPEVIEKKAVEIVSLALDIDLHLGAKLAGAVKPDVQEQTVNLVAQLEIPIILKTQLLGITRSNSASRALTLIPRLENNSFYIRGTAAVAFSKIDSDAALPDLIKIAKTKYDTSVYNYIEYAEDPSSELFNLQIEEEEHNYIRRIAIEALGNIGNQSVIPVLVDILSDNQKDFSVIYAAKEALKKIGNEVLKEPGSEVEIPHLIKDLESEDIGIIMGACDSLGKLGSEAAIDPLIKLLEHEESDVSYYAAKALGEIGSKAARAIPALLRACDANLLQVLPEVLGKIGTEKAVPALLRALGDKSLSLTGKINIRGIAAEALGKIGTKTAIPALIQSLLDEYHFVRQSAAEALGNIGSKEAIPALQQALSDDSDSVRWEVTLALGKLGSDATVSPLIKALRNECDDEMRWMASEALEKVGGAALPLLTESILSTCESYILDGVLYVISSIQGSCKYYNDIIATSSPSEEENSTDTLTNSINTLTHITDTLDMQQYEEILSVISSMSMVMERDPKTFSIIGEESLRQHFLVQLNGRYKGQATGETFNGNGKTDILIRDEGKNIFIAECKFWGGPKLFQETLDQLLGYSTWRDTKLAMLIFNRNKNFSAVLEQIPEQVKKHPNFVRELTYQSETGFRFVIHHPNDNKREHILTVLAFDLPQQTP